MVACNRDLKSYGFVLLILILPMVCLSQSELTDHEGRSVFIRGNATLYGEHINIDKLFVAESATLSVALYDPVTTMTGRLIVRANEIEINGVIDASGAGYTGGGGGKGEWQALSVGTSRYLGFDGSSTYGWKGDGPAGGDVNGGYDTLGLNSDGTTDESLLMGSGGSCGGSAIEMSGAGAGGGGGGGGCGGGFIKLYAQESLKVKGEILTHGVRGQNGGSGDASTGTCFSLPVYPYYQTSTPGVGGYGGDAWPPGEGLGGAGDDNYQCNARGLDGESGGSGAGGGVLLKCNTVNGMELLLRQLNTGHQGRV